MSFEGNKAGSMSGRVQLNWGRGLWDFIRRDLCVFCLFCIFLCFSVAAPWGDGGEEGGGHSPARL